VTGRQTDTTEPAVSNNVV